MGKGLSQMRNVRDDGITRISGCTRTCVELSWQGYVGLLRSGGEREREKI